jgi:ribonucleoside-diphosphate reductase alpha chain
MAGRLYTYLLERVIYPYGRPSVQSLHEELQTAGLMVDMHYSTDEYTAIEKIIDHKRDLKYPHYQLNQIRYKYALRNKVTGKEYESPQFVYMRMAMALAEDEPSAERLVHVKAWYDHFSFNRINCPTPNFVNLGTQLNGYASCCVYTTQDSAASLAAGDHIAYMMTCMSAGIGTHIKTRSLGDSIRNGIIQHQGKLPYYRAMVGAIQANLQNGRGGASTVHYTAFDPEVEVIQKLRHPMTPLNKKIGGCHYSFGSNKFFARKVAKNEDIYLFSYGDVPELYEAQYNKDPNKFEELYTLYANSDKVKVKVNARELLLGALTQSYETGVHYLHQFDTMNKHTPFKEKIYSSNLCLTGNTNIEIASNNAGNFAEIVRLDDFIAKYELGYYTEVYVKSFNGEEVVWSKVSAAAQTGVSTDLYEIESPNGKIIRCTADHMIYTKNRGFVPAKDLTERDELLET